ncbi:MAG: hypothetical protein LBS50_10350 [Prevotellaceae bacterium]|jgi:hypothetical protein|nr:hypothetical protein [Prevotellaceae bacterium]
MKIDKKTTLAEFSVFQNIIKQEQIETLFERLKTRPVPSEICGKKIPENFNLLTWAQFAELQSLKGTDEDFFRPFEIILNLHREKLATCKIFDIFSFMLFVKNELENIAKLFNKIKYAPTPEEKQAGIDKLNFGTFGTLDWYARRMGFCDHAEAEKTPWIRIYKCLEIDSVTGKYEKRLRKIFDDKNKIKK